MPNLRDHGIGVGHFKRGMTYTDVILSPAVVNGGTIEKRPTVVSGCQGVAVDKRNGTVWAAFKQSSGAIKKFDADLNLIASYNDENSNQDLKMITVDTAGDVYIVKEYGYITKINGTTGAIIFNKTLGVSSYWANWAHVHSDNTVTHAYSGNLANTNLTKHNSAGTQLWAISSVMVSGRGSCTDPDGNVYYCGHGNSGNTSSLTLMSFTAAGAERWRKTYADYEGPGSVAWNYKTNQLIACKHMSPGYAYVVDPATGNQISRMNLYSWNIDGIIVDENGEMYKGNYGSTDSFSRYSPSGASKFSSAATGSGVVYQLAVYGDYVYAAYGSTSVTNGLIRHSRYTKYTLQ